MILNLNPKIKHGGMLVDVVPKMLHEGQLTEITIKTSIEPRIIKRNKFTEIVSISPDVMAHQGVAKSASHFYTSGGPGASPDQTNLYMWDLNWNQVNHRHCKDDAPSYIQQINGIYYDQDEHRLYVSSGNHDYDPAQGYVMEYNPDTLAHIGTYDVGQQRSEALCKWRDRWWVVGGSYHSVFEFDLDWNLVKQHDLPGEGWGRHWQAIIIIDDVFYLNHHEGQGENPLRAYTWNGDGFDLVRSDMLLPSTKTTQGAYYDGEYVWWAERHGVSPNVVVQTTVR